MTLSFNGAYERLREYLLYDYDKRYFWFILCAAILHVIVCVLTYYAVGLHPDHYVECVKTSADWFRNYGYLFTSVYSTAHVIVICLAVPLVLGGIHKLEWKSILILSLIIVFLLIDAINDFASLLSINQVSDVTLVIISNVTTASGGQWSC